MSDENENSSALVPKPDLATPERISIKVVSQNGDAIAFALKKTTPLEMLMKSYCSKTGAQIQSLRFLYDGVRLSGKETPVDLGMENGDILDVVLQQLGGNFLLQ
jgi:small ubiquitin-related modifier